ncbi:hypothetical protein CVS40_1950 [Lucilia cuprina]|nr:hypothetical protein CVS40_1950 [Lucilia cuprina]
MMKITNEKKTDRRRSEHFLTDKHVGALDVLTSAEEAQTLAYQCWLFVKDFREPQKKKWYNVLKEYFRYIAGTLDVGNYL